jgi:hypothetical protein
MAYTMNAPGQQAMQRTLDTTLHPGVDGADNRHRVVMVVMVVMVMMM